MSECKQILTVQNSNNIKQKLKKIKILDKDNSIRFSNGVSGIKICKDFILFRKRIVVSIKFRL